MPHEWYRYESEGLHELRVDERYGMDNGRLSTADTWRTLRYTVHGPGQISNQIKEVQLVYESNNNTASPDETRAVYYHFDSLALTDEDGPSCAGTRPA